MLFKCSCMWLDFFSRFVSSTDKYATRTNRKVFETKLCSFLVNSNTTVQLKVDDVVTFSFSSRFNSSSIPIGPTFTALRPDLDWKDLVSTQHTSVPRKQSANGIPLPTRPTMLMRMYSIYWKSFAIKGHTACPKTIGLLDTWRRCERARILYFLRACQGYGSLTSGNLVFCHHWLSCLYRGLC